MPEKPSRQVITFLVLTLAFCLPLYTVIIRRRLLHSRLAPTEVGERVGSELDE